jgi:hypothetical protein
VLSRSILIPREGPVYYGLKGRRIRQAALIEEIGAWKRDRNAKHTKASWHFTTPDARINSGTSTLQSDCIRRLQQRCADSLLKDKVPPRLEEAWSVCAPPSGRIWTYVLKGNERGLATDDVAGRLPGPTT